MLKLCSYGWTTSGKRWRCLEDLIHFFVKDRDILSLLDYIFKKTKPKKNVLKRLTSATLVRRVWTIYFGWVSGCLSGCLYPIIGRTDLAQILGETLHGAWEGLWMKKVSIICLKKNLTFIKYLKIYEIFFMKSGNFLVFCFTMYTQREHVHNWNRRWIWRWS